jgi:hypothetical protein
LIAFLESFVIAEAREHNKGGLVCQTARSEASQDFQTGARLHAHIEKDQDGHFKIAGKVLECLLSARKRNYRVEDFAGSQSAFGEGCVRGGIVND